MKLTKLQREALLVLARYGTKRYSTGRMGGNALQRDAMMLRGSTLASLVRKGLATSDWNALLHDVTYYEITAAGRAAIGAELLACPSCGHEYMRERCSGIRICRKCNGPVYANPSGDEP